ncbi:serine/arginine repetitive matrix 2 [Anaeramoeba flamelloides]|uniref:Serine/arginine repetitive matrix 2 n=1 Tax=Anaeramoeba flamelloides TaxID=1746091 RepID=A0ABQ8Y0N9_9EUKA|nr:serine/arginine repetitive matrix 2 [Anaeramoeba flamelloides]
MYGHQIILSLNSQFFLKLFYENNSHSQIQKNENTFLKLHQEKQSQKINNLKRSRKNPIRIEKEKKIDFNKNKENGMETKQKEENSNVNESGSEKENEKGKGKEKSREKTETNQEKENQTKVKHKQKQKEKHKQKTKKKKKDDLQKNKEEMMKIIIPDISVKAFKLFLDFFYTKKVVLTKNDVWPVLICSFKFQVPELKQMCVSFLLSTLTLSTVLKDLDKAVKHGLYTLVPSLTSFLEMRSEELLLRKGCFNELCHETVYTILTLSGLRINEIELFRRLSERGAYLCHINGQSDSPLNIRKSLNNLLNVIKLETLNSDELIEVIKSNLIEKEVVIERIIKNNNSNEKKLDSEFLNYLKDKNNGLRFNENLLVTLENNLNQNKNSRFIGTNNSDVDNKNEMRVEKTNDLNIINGNGNNKEMEYDQEIEIELDKEIKEEIEKETKKEMERGKEIVTLIERKKKKLIQKYHFQHFNRLQYKDIRQRKFNDKHYHIALLTNDTNSRWKNDVKRSICGKSGKCHVTIFDMNNSLPNIHQLYQFDLIFHYCNKNYQDSSKIGDLLYDCLEKRIPCVVSTCFFGTEDRKRQIGGKFSKIAELKDLCEISQDSEEDDGGSDSSLESESNDNNHKKKKSNSQNVGKKKINNKNVDGDSSEEEDDDDEIECVSRHSKVGKILLPKHKINTSLRSFDGGKKSYRTVGIGEIGETIAKWGDKSFFISIIKATKEKIPLVLINFFPVSQKVFTYTSNKFSDNDFNDCFHKGGEIIIENIIKYLLEKKDIGKEKKQTKKSKKKKKIRINKKIEKEKKKMKEKKKKKKKIKINNPRKEEKVEGEENGKEKKRNKKKEKEKEKKKKKEKEKKGGREKRKRKRKEKEKDKKREKKKKNKKKKKKEKKNKKAGQRNKPIKKKKKKIKINTPNKKKKKRIIKKISIGSKFEK